MRVRTIALLAIGLGTFLPACKKAEPPPPPPRQVSISSHRLLLRLPPDWQLYDQGTQVVIKAPPLTDDDYKKWDKTGQAPNKGMGSVRIHDFGPAAAPGEMAPLLSEFATRMLPKLGHNERRDVEFRRPLVLDGREVEEIGTWHRLNHSMPQRFLFVLNDGAVFALFSDPLGGEESLAGYEAIRQSLHFAAAADTTRR